MRMLIAFIAVCVGFALGAIVIRWLLTGIVPERWFQTIARWCEIGAKLAVATFILVILAVAVVAIAGGF